MKILVTAREVTEVEGDFEIEDGRVREPHLRYDLNEWDDHAIETAVRIAEAANGEDESEIEVVSVTVGPERSEETGRTALAKGVDRAIRVWDDALAEADALDVEAKTRLFAAVVEGESPDLVLTGAEAADDYLGAVGVSVANAVGYAWAAVVNDVRLGVGDESPTEASVACVHRELEGGVEELTEVDLPAVLTTQVGLAEPRPPSARETNRARREEIDVRDLGDLGLSAGDVADRVRVTGVSRPESESDVTLFEGDAEESATRLAATLRERGVGTE